MAVHRLMASFLLAVLLCLSAEAYADESAQSYPSRRILFIVPASAGGPSDVVARLVAQKLAVALGKDIIARLPGIEFE